MRLRQEILLILCEYYKVYGADSTQFKACFEALNMLLKIEDLPIITLEEINRSC